MRIGSATEKGTIDMNKSSNTWSLEASFVAKTQVFVGLHCVRVVDGAIHSHKDGVESNGASLLVGT
jgi:hypothetical protein